MSLQSYIGRLLEREATHPTVTAWLARLDALPSIEAPVAGADTVATARDELP